MRSQNLKTHSRRRAAGLSIVELMVGLAICSALLVAVASAYVASSKAVEVNERFTQANQGARVAMSQLQAAIRRSDQCQVPSSIRVNLITFDSKDVSYAYDSASQQLRRIANATSTTTVLARNVTAATFTADSENYPGTSTPRVVRVTISIDIKVGTEQVHMSGSAVPRRAMVY